MSKMNHGGRGLQRAMSRVLVTQICTLVVMTLTAIGITGCGSESESLAWETDQQGLFYTQDVSKAEEEVGFRILTPTYLPDNLCGPPHIIGPVQGSLWMSDNDDEVGVELTYGAPDTVEGLLILNEWNFEFGPPDPNINEGYEVFRIDETEVVEKEHIETIVGGGGPDGFIDHPGFLFWWNDGDIYYQAGIYHYERDEAVRIIESMIEQQ